MQGPSADSAAGSGPGAGPGASETLDDLLLLIRSRYGLIHLRTGEEERAGLLLRHLADRLGVPLFAWSRLDGLKRADLDEPVYDTADAGQALDHVRASGRPTVYHFRGLGAGLAGDPDLGDRLGRAARTLEGVDGAMVLTGHELELTPPLRRMAAVVDLPGPRPDQFRRLLGRIVRDVSRRRQVDVELARDEITALVNHLSGLTLMEGEKILTKAIVEDGRLAADDIAHVIEAKRRIVEEEGLLEYYPAGAGLAEIADLEALKTWLDRRKAVLEAPDRAREFGLPFPRGVLLLGVPGCGKSLSAKAVARSWSLPLLKLDPSNLYNRYVGESERNFRRAVRTAERIAPVVLWIDELEKAFAAGGTEDGGVSQRILGSFLSWLQERRGDVFVAATANDVERVPPELLRKGRFDEVFFVDLPDGPTRREIFRIHLERRDRHPGALDLDALAGATAGFSGAEIEEVVVSGLYTAFAEGSDLTAQLLLGEIEATRPLSVTRAEDVERIRAWARDRAVPAN